MRLRVRNWPKLASLQALLTDAGTVRDMSWRLVCILYGGWLVRLKMF